MDLLLCAATELEIKPTLELIDRHAGLQSRVEVLVTGVGLTAAAYALTKRLCADRPRLVVQAGIAGSLDDGLEPGDTVVVERESIGDLGVFEGGSFRSLFGLGLVALNEPPWTEGKLCNDPLLLRTTGLPMVDGVSINEITTHPERILHYKTASGASVESMEGAALHYVCLMEKVPFLQIRTVSNFVGERDKSKWQLQQALANLNRHLELLLLKLCHL
ncbi:futalosine hydrolase [Paraflavisolibacter sp. H34]|uniref:futalosine hydrolase n=1 Tax=Huijunlia imazamoxiresistens TaxID=3127457 RepID=UPI003018EBD2